MAIPFYINSDAGDENQHRHRRSPERVNSPSYGAPVLPSEGRVQIQIVVATPKPSSWPISVPPAQFAAATISPSPLQLRRRSSSNCDSSVDTSIFTFTCDKSFVLDGLVLSMISNSGEEAAEAETESSSSSPSPSPSHSNRARVPDVVPDRDADPDTTFRDIGIALREIADSYHREHIYEKQQAQEVEPPTVEKQNRQNKAPHPRRWSPNQCRQRLQTIGAGGLLLGIGISAGVALFCARQ